VTLLVTWLAASILGVVFASHIPNPEKYAIDFAFAAAFIAIARSLWRGHADILPWITAIGVVILTTQLKLVSRND